jgi:AraC-like DNA-binding protein
MTAMAADPTDIATFCGRMRQAELGDIRAVEVTSHGARVQRSAAHIACSGESAFLLEVQMSGRSITRQDGREASLETGDFTLCDCARPFQVYCEEPIQMLVLRLPRTVLGKYLDCSEAVTAIPMVAAQESNGLTSRFLQDVWGRPTSMLDPVRAMRVGRAALELIAYAYSALAEVRVGPSVASRSLRLRVANYIEANLGDPSLTPTSIAGAFRISPRYLHRIWKTGEESLARYILQRRLEECARALSDPLHSARSITSIAFDWGFVGMSHFCTAFREQYAASPRAYRHERARVDPL